MNMEQKAFYITTAIPYASRKPHFGNTYEVIMSDAVARFRRSEGFDVEFGTGTDEHGQKVEDLARAAGITPKEYVDRVVAEIRGVWDRMNTSYDHFIRTTDPYHEQAVSKMFKRFYDQGDIYKGHYEGWYCKPCESFFTATQVTDGKCPDCGAPVEQAREEAYFFKMSKYADRLIEHIGTHPGFIQPESRKKEMLNNFLKVEGGLQDLCVSRSTFTWGVKTFDPKHVCYVWIDALSNYITALGYDPDKTYEEQSEKFRKFWPCDVHVIGKDILRFHTIYWPIFLMALGLPLPKKIFGHPWFNFGLDKMSKSKGNVIYADELADHFGVDGVRYYALAEMPYNNDGSITYENVIKRYNTDLVNNLGNLVKRTLDMQKKYFDKVIAAPTAPEALDGELKNACFTAYGKVKEAVESYHIADATAALMELFSRANKYIDETTPWTLAKDETKKERLGTVLYELLSAIRFGAVLLAPFLPETSKEILTELAAKPELDAIGESVKSGRHGDILFDRFLTEDAYHSLVPGDTVGDSRVLFARIDEEKKLTELEEIRKARMAAAAKAAEKAADGKSETGKPAEKTKDGASGAGEPADGANAAKQSGGKPEGCAQIGIDDFLNVELRVAEILSAEPIPKAKKLLRLRVSLGDEERQVVSGIAKFYQPNDLIGKKVILVSNLKPATLCGVESYGMLLASGEEQVRVIFLDPETPNGERIH